jgi:Protein of unknown function (DUF1579)
MRVRAANVLLMLVLAGVPAAAQTPAAARQGAEYKRLDQFTGSWTTTGTTLAGHQAGAGKLSAGETYEWMAGGYFLIHRWDVQLGGGTVAGMEVLGYDARTKAFTSRFFDSTGTSGTLRATPQGNAWTWAGDADANGKPVKQRCTTILVNPDTFTTRCEYSPDGFKWVPALESRSTRVK